MLSLFAVPACTFFASVSTRGNGISGHCGGRRLPPPRNDFHVQHSHRPPCRHPRAFRRPLLLLENDGTEGASEESRPTSSEDTHLVPPALAADATDPSRKSKSVSDDDGAEEGHPADLQCLLERLLSLKRRLYLEFRRVLGALVALLTRSLQNTEAWVRDDVVGQLLASALALVLFFAGVAAFAAWNVVVLGGRQWAGPTAVTVPVVRLPATSATAGGGGIRIQKARWSAPKIQASYGDNLSEKSR